MTKLNKTVTKVLKLTFFRDYNDVRHIHKQMSSELVGRLNLLLLLVDRMSIHVTDRS